MEIPAGRIHPEGPGSVAVRFPRGKTKGELKKTGDAPDGKWPGFLPRPDEKVRVRSFGILISQRQPYHWGALISSEGLGFALQVKMPCRTRIPVGMMFRPFVVAFDALRRCFHTGIVTQCGLCRTKRVESQCLCLPKALEGVSLSRRFYPNNMS